MNQLSMFDSGPAFPLTHEDVLALHRTYVAEGEADPDAFTWSPVAKGFSYSIFGTKVFEHRPGDAASARLVIDGRSRSAANMDGTELAAWLEGLRAKKKRLFRELITERFACCNDFQRCSDAGACIHPEDRFYNGCYYRRNLEAGRNFYRKEG